MPVWLVGTPPIRSLPTPSHPDGPRHERSSGPVALPPGRVRPRRPGLRPYASGIPACRDPRPAESVHPPSQGDGHGQPGDPHRQPDQGRGEPAIERQAHDAHAARHQQHWRDSEGNRQEETEYHAVICFGRLAEVCALYCTRGRRVYVEGKLRTRDYTGGDGLRRFSTEVVAESVKLLRPVAQRGPGDRGARRERLGGAPGGELTDRSKRSGSRTPGGHPGRSPWAGAGVDRRRPERRRHG